MTCLENNKAWKYITLGVAQVGELVSAKVIEHCLNTTLLIETHTSALKIDQGNSQGDAKQRWSDSVFLLCDTILILKNGIRIQTKSCIGWNHTIGIR